MARFCAALFAALLVLPLAASAAENRGLVVVLPLDAREATLTRATLMTLEEAVRTVAGDELKPRGYTVLTGETTLALLADNGVDPNQACEASCALETARQLKAKLFISGSVATSEGEYVAFIRLFENETGTQLASVQLEAPTVKDLRRDFAAKAAAFFTKALGGGTRVARAEVEPVPVQPRVAPVAPVEPPATPGPLHVQLAGKELDGLQVSVKSARGVAKCAKPLSMGLACALEGIQPGPIELSLTTATGRRLTKAAQYAGGEDPAMWLGEEPNMFKGHLWAGVAMAVLGGGALLAKNAAFEPGEDDYGLSITGYLFLGMGGLFGLIGGIGSAVPPDIMVAPLAPNAPRDPVAK